MSFRSIERFFSFFIHHSNITFSFFCIFFLLSAPLLSFLSTFSPNTHHFIISTPLSPSHWRPFPLYQHSSLLAISISFLLSASLSSSHQHSLLPFINTPSYQDIFLYLSTPLSPSTFLLSTPLSSIYIHPFPQSINTPFLLSTPFSSIYQHTFPPINTPPPPTPLSIVEM